MRNSIEMYTVFKKPSRNLELKNSMNKMKNTMDSFNNRPHQTGKKMSELSSFEITQFNKEKKNKESLHDI